MKGVEGCREVKTKELRIACRSVHSHKTKFCWVSSTFLSHFLSKSELYLVKAGCLENLFALRNVYGTVIIFSIYIHFSRCTLHQVIKLSVLCIHSLLLVCCKCFANFNQLRYIRHYVIIPITASFFQWVISAIDSAIISLLESANMYEKQDKLSKIAPSE